MSVIATRRIDQVACAERRTKNDRVLRAVTYSSVRSEKLQWRQRHAKAHSHAVLSSIHQIQLASVS